MAAPPLRRALQLEYTCLHAAPPGLLPWEERPAEHPFRGHWHGPGGPAVKPAAFDYVAVDSAEQAVDRLEEYGDEGKLIAGGQSLVPMLNFRLARPTALVDINGITSLAGVQNGGGRVRIGALTRQTTIEKTSWLVERCPSIKEAVQLIGHRAIRNRGTVGGSLAHADPAAEWGAISVAFDGEMVLQGRGGKRTVAAGDFFRGYLTTALADNELLTEVSLALPDGRYGDAYIELSRRAGDFALAGVLVVLELSDTSTVARCRVGLLGLGDRPLRALTVEESLTGQAAGDEALTEASALLDSDVEPRDDIHGSAAYKRKVARVLLSRTLMRARDRAMDRSS